MFKKTDVQVKLDDVNILNLCYFQVDFFKINSNFFRTTLIVLWLDFVMTQNSKPLS